MTQLHTSKAWSIKLILKILCIPYTICCWFLIETWIFYLCTLCHCLVKRWKEEKSLSFSLAVQKLLVNMSNLISTLSYILIILTFIVGSNDNKDPTFTHFKQQQCNISHNCAYPERIDTHSILIAIDGTGMRKHFENINENTDRKYSSTIGVNHNHQWIWKSHVANFWEDYQGMI